jgi:hypothetical protein
VQNDFYAYGTFSANRAPILHRRKHYLKIDQNEIPHDPRHLGDPLGASYTISEPTAHSTQIEHQSCIKSSTISKRTESSFDLSLVTEVSPRVCPKQFLCYATFGANQAPILHQEKHYPQTDQTELPLERRHLGV